MSVGGKSAAVYSHSHSRFYLKISIMMTHAFVAVLLLSSLHITCKRKPLSLMVSTPCCNLAVQVYTGLSLHLFESVKMCVGNPDTYLMEAWKKNCTSLHNGSGMLN